MQLCLSIQSQEERPYQRYSEIPSNYYLQLDWLAICKKRSICREKKRHKERSLWNLYLSVQSQGERCYRCCSEIPSSCLVAVRLAGYLQIKVKASAGKSSVTRNDHVESLPIMRKYQSNFFRKIIETLLAVAFSNYL